MESHYLFTNLQSPPNLIPSLKAVSHKSSIAVLLIGCIVIFGWMFDITSLKSLWPGLVTMKTNTALSFICGGAALWLWHEQAQNHQKKTTRKPQHILFQLAFFFFPFMVLLIGGLTLVEYIWNYNLGIDQLLFQESVTAVGTYAPNRMAPNTAVSFLLLGAAQLLLNYSYKQDRLIQNLSLIAFLIALLGLIGYAYGITSFYGLGNYTQMALHTAITLILLSLGILLARPDHGIMAVVTSNNAGGLMARSLSPAAIAIPPILGGLVLSGYRLQAYEPEIGLSLLGIFNVVIFAVLIWWTAKALGELDIKRQQAEDQIWQLNIELQKRVEQLQTTLDQLQRTQAQLIQTEKMSMVGGLVAGIAEQINNPVSFIYGNLSHAQYYTQDLLAILDCYQKEYAHPTPAIEAEMERCNLAYIMTDFPKLLDSIKIKAERIRDLVAWLGNFCSLDEAERQTIDLHTRLNKTLILLNHRLKAKLHHPAIALIKEYSDLPLVECFPTQLSQVFMNILTNAIDALDEYNRQRTPAEIKAKPSTIIIRTELVDAGTEHPIESLNSSLRTPYVVIRIADNGPGINDEIRPHLFEPFFTTKPISKGTGLGLAMSYQIVVEKHHGEIECLSIPGEGTEFMIKIPVKQP